LPRWGALDGVAIGSAKRHYPASAFLARFQLLKRKARLAKKHGEQKQKKREKA
jgi:hypothetical protein